MKNNQNLEYFAGKVCSVFTGPLNRDFKLEGANYLQQFYHYFLGVVEAIDEQGLLLRQVGSGLKIYFFKQSLIAIAEEEVLDPNKPEDEATIQEFKTIVTNEPQELPPSIEMPDFLDVDTMTSMASNLKNSFGKQNV